MRALGEASDPPFGMVVVEVRAADGRKFPYELPRELWPWVAYLLGRAAGEVLADGKPPEGGSHAG
jgi:hypothetical protein